MGHVHNALDRATELVRGFRRAMGLLGPDGGVERFGETLTPVMDMWSQPHWNTLRGDWLQWCSGTSAANAGFRSRVRLRPVSTSKMIVVVHHIECLSAFFIQAALAVDLPTSLGTIGQRDTRNPSDNRVAFTSDNTAAADGTNRFLVGNVPFRYNGPPIIIHTDGDGVNSGALTVQSIADNVACTASICYSIHDLIPGENRLS